jgi:dual specificity tyrosine-phosphorylation-regulated kinase 1
MLAASVQIELLFKKSFPIILSCSHILYGSFGQVVSAYDKYEEIEVAIKIIKSKRPFFVQAQTEIELLLVVKNLDPNDEHNIVQLKHHFVFRNHQYLVFEMLSFSLYELLNSTK